ncbi:hypothetical protein DERF_009885 [Dermatophagoides farinae]|uniref:Uncharacterized protein n=1 Tax=Dermatophagoides farinae TaxID=6954 RepID=A0A922HXT4_DERFA|nr:hypothetical protein DERF_009885 [Dermatophagoides farinae]
MDSLFSYHCRICNCSYDIPLRGCSHYPMAKCNPYEPCRICTAGQSSSGQSIAGGGPGAASPHWHSHHHDDQFSPDICHYGPCPV